MRARTGAAGQFIRLSRVSDEGQAGQWDAVVLGVCYANCAGCRGRVTDQNI
jgi:hypothetical protein